MELFSIQTEIKHNENTVGKTKCQQLNNNSDSTVGSDS